MKKNIGIFFLFTFTIILILKTSPRESKIMELNYIVTSNGSPNSFDPLDGDKTNNLASMRMLYATPIEISKDNSLISNVLEQFNYNVETKVITFKLKNNIKFSDSTPITTRDIAIAITRMAYTRPNFPVIKDIIGLSEWKNSKQGLETFPAGIKINNGEIEIHLSKSRQNPLFRFCLELFSIIPEKCIDLKSGKMKCIIPPSSGYYTIYSQSAEEIIFNKRDNLVNTAEEIQYKKINFKFLNIENICTEKIKENTIIVANELGFVTSECSKYFSQDQLHWTPAARFGSLVFNSNIAPFNKNINRIYFADQIREKIKKNYPNLIIEKSIFSSLLPGYLPINKFSSTDKKEMPSKFEGKKISILKRTKDINIYRDAIEEVAISLKMNIEYISDTSDEYLDQAFLNGTLQVDTFNSGFWAQDPVGDLSMLFTPNLHSSLHFTWDDKKIYSQLDSINNEIDPVILKEKMEQFNIYLNETALIVPLVHFRRLFITSETLSSLNLPQAVTSPAPWQLIPTK